MRTLALTTLAVVLVACGASSADTTATTATLTTRPPTTQTTSGPATTEPPSTTVPATTLPAGVFEISVSSGSVTGGGRLEVALGDQVTIRVRSDVADEAHLHGYDIHADVGPDVVGEISFEATVPGIFEIELENGGLMLGELVVQ